MSNNELADKLAWVSRNLNFTQNLVVTSNLAPLNKRGKVVETLTEFVDQINANISVLPNTIGFENKNITNELKVVRVNAVSIIEALQDKVCTASQAKKTLRKVSKNLKNVRVLIESKLAEYIISVEGQAGKSVEDVKSDVLQKVIAADRPKVVLKDLSEIGQYTDFIQQLKDAVEATKPKEDGSEAPLMIDPQKADELLKSYDRASTDFTYGDSSNKYNERVNQSVLETKTSMEKIASKIPTSISLNKLGYVIVKSPIVSITEHFIPDNLLKKSGIKFMRISSNFFHYATGLSATKGPSTNYIIIENQLLLAMPFADIDKDTSTSYRDIMRSLERSLGKLMPMPFGKTPNNKLGDEKLFTPHRRFVFGNKKFPGIAFIWLVPESVYSTLTSVNIEQVDFPIADMKSGLEPESATGKGPNPLIKQKLERESDRDARIEKFREKKARWEQASEKVNKLLSNQVEIATSYKNKLADLQDALTKDQAQLVTQTQGLDHFTAKSPKYKAQLGAVTLTKNSIAQTENEISTLKGQIRAIDKSKGYLKDQIKEAMIEFNKS